MTAPRIHQARFAEALEALDFMVGWHGPAFMPVQLADAGVTFWHRCGRAGDGARLARVVRWHDERLDTEILLGLPQRRPCNGGVHEATVLWCRVEGGDQLARARRFRPLPSLVLQEGSSTRRWLLWALERPVSYRQLRDANRRIAYAVHAVQKWSDPDLVRLPAPGTCLRSERDRPVPIVVGRLTTAAYELEQVVGRVPGVRGALREPPPRDAWLSGVARERVR